VILDNLTREQVKFFEDRAWKVGAEMTVTEAEFARQGSRLFDVTVYGGCPWLKGKKCLARGNKLRPAVCENIQPGSQSCLAHRKH